MNLLDFDFFILKFFNHPTFPFNFIFLFLTEGVYVFLFILAYLFYKKDKKKFYHFLVSFSLGFVFITFLKYLFNRRRPFIAFPNDFTTISLKLTPSFPSHHAFIAFFLLNFVFKNFEKKKKILAIYLLTIPFFSLYNGVHYPSDLLVGAAIGYLFPILISEKLTLTLLKKFGFFKGGGLLTKVLIKFRKKVQNQILLLKTESKNLQLTKSILNFLKFCFLFVFSSKKWRQKEKFQKRMVSLKSSQN